ncbi:MAG: SIMPL domain-containing protein [Bacteroidota bacterium]
MATASAQPQPEKAVVRSVIVNGQGTINVPPDQVRLSVQVNTRGESASAAMTEASKRTNAILASLKEYGIDAKDIQTSRVTVTAILDYEKRVQPPPIVGYAGTNEFTILFKGKNMEKVGGFLDHAVVAGASSFSGLTYESSKQRELERDALKRAAADAKSRAEVLAKELGATLGTVTTISESVSGGGPAPMLRGGLMMESASTAAPVMTGELSINAQVNVTFELK